ncbi:MAG: PKD domain-containing protein [Thermoplasmata archaeon]|nr:PKD domain-containing protein [Thermoplasmata archaeon]
MPYTSRGRPILGAFAVLLLVAIAGSSGGASSDLRAGAIPPPLASTITLTVASSLPGPPGLYSWQILPANITFHAQLSGSGASVGTPSWNFGDGHAISGGWVRANIFSDPGTYLVVAVENDSTGQVATGSFPVLLEGAYNPWAGFASIVAASPQVAPDNQSVSFSPGTAPGSVLSTSWSFGDGGSSNRTNPSHAFRAGTYSVRLVERVTTVGSLNNSSSAHNLTSYVTVVSVAPGGPLTATVATTNATWWSPGGCNGGPIELNETFVAAIAGGFAPYSAMWSFGDGTMISSPGPVFHTWSNVGPNTARLTVTDSHGNVATAVVATALPTPYSSCPPIFLPLPPSPLVSPVAPTLLVLLLGSGIATIAVAVVVVVRFGPSRPPNWS